MLRTAGWFRQILAGRSHRHSCHHASKLDLSGGVKTVHVLEINELLVGVAKRDKTEINR